MTLTEKLNRIEAKIKLGLPLTNYEHSMWVLYGKKV